MNLCCFGCPCIILYCNETVQLVVSDAVIYPPGHLRGDGVGAIRTYAGIIGFFET